MVNREHLLTALKTVIDPELHCNIVDLGLVYGVELKDNGRVEIDLTLTTPACPLAPHIMGQIKTALNKVRNVKDVVVNLVFDPPWSLAKIDPNLRLELFPNYMPSFTPRDSDGAELI